MGLYFCQIVLEDVESQSFLMDAVVDFTELELELIEALQLFILRSQGCRDKKGEEENRLHVEPRLNKSICFPAADIENIR